MVSPRSIHLFLSVFFILSTGPVSAASLDTVARDVSKSHNLAVSEKKELDTDIELKRQNLLQKIRSLQKTRAMEEELLLQDKKSLERLAGQRDKLQHEITTRLASKEELDTIFLDHIRNFLGLVETSAYFSQRPERLVKLKSYLGRKQLFDLQDMAGLLNMYFEDMTAGAENIRYRGTILDRGGEEVQAEIIRLGHIAAMYKTDQATGFLTLSPGSNRLLMSGDPGYFVNRSLTSFLKGEQTTTPLDISGGVAINQLSRTETLKDRLKSGGVLVFPILLVGLVAIVLTIERVIFLSQVRQNTDALMTNVTELVLDGDFDKALETTEPHSNRPTGRVIMSGLAHKDENGDVIESAISEAILSQTPRLERFIGTLKVLAAVAPLLGLLGTVTGMINTFQVITTHGTGDPRLMAGGISEAMITTQVGLAVAIPILMTASFLGGRVRNIARDMEEKGIALMGALLRHKNIPLQP